MPDSTRPGDRLLGEQGGIVHQYVDPAQGIRRSTRDPLHGSGIAEITGQHGVTIAGKAGEHLLSPVGGSAAVQRDPVPGGGEGPRGRGTHAPRRTRDQHTSRLSHP